MTMKKQTSKMRHKRRPLLQTEDRYTRIKELVDTRTPIYSKIADLTVTTDDRPIRKVVNEILHNLEKA